ncbi:MAG: arsenate reductase ArsC [Thaumarchaeota archaeon]|nr:arsenate reductase ArsC [Nitrososphaerota archaeon]
MAVKNVVFVCVGNASRSQMAEAFFNSLAKDAKAISGGIKLAKMVDPVTVQVMKEVGIDMSKNKPKRIGETDIQRADMIISMCEYSCPVIGKQTEHWEVEDTKGKEIDAVRRVRDKIYERVKELLEKKSRF